MRRDERGRARPGRGARMAVAVGLAVTLGLALGAMPAAGQVRFEWPDTTVDVAGYPTVYQCLAATNRVTRGLRRRDELAARGDTLPEAWQRDVGPLPATVAATDGSGRVPRWSGPCWIVFVEFAHVRDSRGA